MKLAYIIGDLGNGGQERQLVYLVTELKKKGHEILVIIWNNEVSNTAYLDKLTQLNIDVISFMTNQSLYDKIRISRKGIKKFQPIILHSFTFYVNFFAGLITLFSKTKGVGGIRNRLFLHKINSGNLITFLSICFPQKKIANNYKFLEQFNVPLLSKWIKKNTIIVTNGIALENFFPHYISQNTLIKSASIGRLANEKRIDLLIQVIYEIKKKGIDIIHYHAGKGDLLNSLIDKVNAYQLSDQFIFCGDTDNISKFLSDKSIFLHTSDFEGFPNVIMEAMCCGKAIITTNSGDTEYLIEDAKNGYLINCGDVESIIDKYLFLVQNPETIIKLGKDARMYAELHFGLDKFVDTTLNVYKKICAE